MNRIFAILALFVICCTRGTDPKDTPVVVVGDWYNTISTEVVLRNTLGNRISSDHLESDGFSLTTSISEPNYYTLNCDSQALILYLAPDYDLHLEVSSDGNNMEVLFSGKGSENNRYLQAFSAFERANKPPDLELQTKTEEEFFIAARRYRSKCDGFLNHYLTTNVNLSPSFIEKERARILYAWAKQLTSYPEAHIYHREDDDFVVSDTYHDYKKKVSLNASDLLGLKEYQEFLTLYVKTEAEILRSKGDMRSHEQICFDIVNQHISEQPVKDFIWYALLRETIRNGADEQLVGLVDYFANECENPSLIADIKAMYYSLVRPGSG